ncbi:DUF3231 family protein [Peribacillus sp. SCS-155]|uniref:DUF3231 family protein n=1 Tax=Peribacillus sedimenti TaxID=3115297 RepID=UPI0039062B50
MDNIFESATTALRTMMTNEKKKPLHIGEVMACWTYLTTLEYALSFEEIGLNTTTDEEVTNMLNDAIKLCHGQAKELRDFLVHEGVALPNGPEPRPDSNPNDVPNGVRMTDDEIANSVSIKIAAAVVKCAASQSESIRTDVGLMFLKFQAQHISFALTLKALMEKRGWLKVPPYYQPPGIPEAH